MKFLQFDNSSAIAQISLNDNVVGISFTSNPSKFYEFACDDVKDFEDSVNVVIENDDSLGRFISLARKDGTLTAV